MRAARRVTGSVCRDKTTAALPASGHFRWRRRRYRSAGSKSARPQVNPPASMRREPPRSAPTRASGGRTRCPMCDSDQRLLSGSRRIPPLFTIAEYRRATRTWRNSSTASRTRRQSTAARSGAWTVALCVNVAMRETTPCWGADFMTKRTTASARLRTVSGWRPAPQSATPSCMRMTPPAKEGLRPWYRSKAESLRWVVWAALDELVE